MVKFFLQKFTTSRDMPVKVQREYGVENTRRIFRYRKTIVKKEWKTMLLYMLKRGWKTTLHVKYSLSVFLKMIFGAG